MVQDNSPKHGFCKKNGVHFFKHYPQKNNQSIHHTKKKDFNSILRKKEMMNCPSQDSSGKKLYRQETKSRIATKYAIEKIPELLLIKLVADYVEANRTYKEEAKKADTDHN